MTHRPRRYVAYLALVGVAVVAALVGRHLLGLGVERPPAAAAVPVGGPFALIDHDGRRRTDADFRGRYMLVFFGYTYCPDVCPTTLATVAAALDALGAKAERIVPVFITVDPGRDTPEVLKAYVPQFHPRLVGLTGEDDAIKAAAKAYRAYYARGKDEGGAYLMEHSTILYLIGPDGTFRQHFTHEVTAEILAKRLESLP